MLVSNMFNGEQFLYQLSAAGHRFAKSIHDGGLSEAHAKGGVAERLVVR